MSFFFPDDTPMEVIGSGAKGRRRTLGPPFYGRRLVLQSEPRFQVATVQHVLIGRSKFE